MAQLNYSLMFGFLLGRPTCIWWRK